MHEGTVVRWLKDEGSAVEVGEPIAEIETDKAIVELESHTSGILKTILVQEGVSVSVGQPIAVLGEEDELVFRREHEPIQSGSQVFRREDEAPQADIDAFHEQAESPFPRPGARLEVPTDGPPLEPARVVRASPVARLLAEEREIDLSQIEGTGPGGRITRDDVLDFEPQSVQEAALEQEEAQADRPAIPLPGERQGPFFEVAEAETQVTEPLPQEFAESVHTVNQDVAVEAEPQVAEPVHAVYEDMEQEPEPEVVQPVDEVEQTSDEEAEEEPEPEVVHPVDEVVQVVDEETEEEPEPEVVHPVDEVVQVVDEEAEEEPKPEAVQEALQQEVREVPLSRMREQIARVTVRSKQEKPHFYISAEVDMAKALELRQQINSELAGEDIHITVNDLIIKACAAALKRFPRFNAYYGDDGIRMNDELNIGIAVSTDEGLIVPAVLDCAGRSLGDVAAAAKDLADRAGAGTLSPQEYAGGTFAISNLGMFDVTSFTAIIQPPQTAVLAVGTITKRPVVKNDEVTVGQIMTATLSADHRMVDGADGARFIGEVKRLLENPMHLLV
jgi:pyruvate dehydrogenase E2 component (dihydrolipoamide acetyltransferase)